MCPNIGNCSVADRRLRVDTTNGAQCRECGRALIEVLEEPPPPPRPWGRWILLSGGAAAVAVLGSAVLLLHKGGAARTIEPSAPVVLRLAGSNTVGSRLGPAWVTQFLKDKGFIETTESSERLGETVVTGHRPVTGERVRVVIAAHGTATGFEALAAGGADIAMASRSIEDKEVRALSGLGDMRAQSNEHVVALDGVAVVVHGANPVEKVSLADLAGLFSGKTTSWSQIGGKDLPVHVYARDDKSGTWETFRSLVLAPSGAALGPRVVRFEDSTALADAVAGDPGGIGFIGLPYIGPTKALAIFDAGGVAVRPSAFTVATEDYPLTRRLYFYNSATPSHAVSDLTAFILSAEGQDMVRRQGFVPLTVEAVSAAAPSDPPDYAKVTAGAMRLSVDFRFESGGAQLDNKGRQDLDRVVDFLAQGGRRQDVTLVGFTDNSGDAATNLALSRTRAAQIAKELAVRGVKAAAAIGLGGELPVASNATDEGRNRNRRVEIWVKGLKG